MAGPCRAVPEAVPPPPHSHTDHRAHNRKFTPTFSPIIFACRFKQNFDPIPRLYTASGYVLSLRKKKKKTSTRMFDTLGQEKMLLGIPRVFFVCVFFVAERVGHGVD